MRRKVKLLSLLLVLVMLLVNMNYANAKTVKFSKKKVSFQATKCSDRVIVKLSNKNKLDASVDIIVKFYDEKNKLIDAADKEGCIVEKKYFAFQEFQKSKDDYSYYKVSISSKEETYYKLCGSKVKYKSIKTDKEIKVIVNNKLKYDVTVIPTALFYKNGKLISLSKPFTFFGDTVKKKKSKVIVLDIPQDSETYESIDFDSYKVYLNGYKD